MTLLRELNKGIFRDNPLFRLMLGMCPSLAVTTTMKNGLGMGLATTFVLICTNMVISLLRKIIPGGIRIPSYIVIVAAFVTITEMYMHAYLPGLYKSLGIFIPLIVVNCIILGRAEAFASKNPLFFSLADGLGMGIGFTLALISLGMFREVLGSGTIFGYVLFGSWFKPAIIMILPPGAFITLGFILAFFNRKRAINNVSEVIR